LTILPSTTRRRLLIVDDDPDILRMLVVKFERLGYLVSAFDRGVDASIAALEGFRAGTCFDAYILDCALPHFDGFTIARMIRLAEKTEVTSCRARIVVYTAYARTVENSTLVESSGVDAYFVKGSDDEQMAEQIAQWLEEEDDA
jgi:CheY-like chemotaxis protein